MIFGRPSSHVVMMIYVLIMGVLLVFTGYHLFQAGDPVYKSEFLLAAPYVVALSSLGSKAHRSYYLCAALSFILPAFLIGTLLLILIKVPRATFSELAPSSFGAILLFVLFFRYTFGSASRSFYGQRITVASSDGGLGIATWVSRMPANALTWASNIVASVPTRM
ncbi:MAG: hypothetical protein RB191_00265 [Terriglobia bacterium]|nr:hypothetical protein [Terriglobia bacterium]